MSEPIWIPCEGSGAGLNLLNTNTGVGGCKMCGQWLSSHDGKAPEHNRDDITSRFLRGDFDV